MSPTCLWRCLLHAPNDELRNELVPINRKYNIAMLLKSVNGYLAKLPDKRKATIEYVLPDGVNDELEHAKQLADLLRETPCKINLIPFNPFPHSGYERPSNNLYLSLPAIIWSSRAMW